MCEFIGNRQIARLEKLIKKRMRNEKVPWKTLMGLALTGVVTCGYVAFKYFQR